MSKKKSNRVGTQADYRRFGTAVVILNAVLLAGVFLLFSLYTAAYRRRLTTENLGNIANMNRSAAMNATALISSWNYTLDDIAQLVSRSSMTRDELLTYISNMNSVDGRYYELIGADYTGYLARQNPDGTFPALNYSNASYSDLHRVFDQAAAGVAQGGDIRFAPEFTDAGENAVKFFAIYKPLTLPDENGEPVVYTLLLGARAKDVLAVLNNQSDYEGQSTVLIDPEGNYIVSNTNFKSDNFFQYLYVYNDLTLDEKNDVKTQVAAAGSGELFYKNAGVVVEDSVYRYERMSTNGWYCVTCVPISSFHTPAIDLSYTLFAILLLLALLVVDVSWLQYMNKSLRVSMEQERVASAAKGNFMSRMSHEIRTPLNAVIGYNTIARNDLSQVQTEAERRQAEMKVLDSLTKSDIASRHLLTIINDVLDMSAIESGKLSVADELFDLKGLISSLTTIFYTQAATKGVSFDVAIGSLSDEWFSGDQMRVNQILTNLLSNAVKFTPDGGSVRLDIEELECPEPDKARLRFQVRDTGIGMEKDYLSHIWTPFEQADSSISRRFGGTGLGLSITKSLVDLMGGAITVESKPGAGSCFMVELSFRRAAQPQGEQVYDFSGIDALVVDDDPTTCDYIRLLFTRCRAKCVTVTSGAAALEAVAAAAREGRRFSVCIVDWRLSGMDGIETVRRIRNISGENMPSVILTAYDYSEVADEAAKAGVTRFLSKPLFQSTLFDLLASLSGQRPLREVRSNSTYDFGGARVLLAEDNNMNMEIARRIMESAGLVVDSAWNGREAVEMFTASAPGTYMAILMDVHMPQMDGHEATRAIRASGHKQGKTVPIIAMTADAFAENVAEAMAAGMNDHIAKPIDVNTLFATLSKYAEKQ